MNIYETAKRVSGNKKMTDAECLKFIVDQWGLVCSWLRENEGELTGYFPVCRIHRDDLEQEGYDIRKVTDDTMKELAEKMGDAYLGDGYWVDIGIIADDLKIKQKK